MTNEDLVKLIQDGKTEYLPKLWEQIEAFISLMAYRRLTSLPKHYEQFRDDMVNHAYFGFLKAANTYKADAGGSFLTFLTYHLKTGFNEVIYGGRTTKAMREPLNNAVSLDVPIGDAEGLTIADTLIDSQSEACYRHIEDTDFWHEINTILQKAIDNIADEKPREVVRTMFENGMSLVNAHASIEAMGGDMTYQQCKDNYQKGMRSVRHYIRAYTGKSINRNSSITEYTQSCYRGGLHSFRRTGMSCVEWAVIRQEIDEMRADVAQCLRY